MSETKSVKIRKPIGKLWRDFGRWRWTLKELKYINKVPTNILNAYNVIIFQVGGVNSNDQIYRRPITDTGSGWTQMNGGLVEISASGNGFV